MYSVIRVQSIYLEKKGDGSFSLYSIHELQLEEINLTENEQIVDLVDAKLYYSSSFTDLLPAVELSYMINHNLC